MGYNVVSDFIIIIFKYSFLYLAMDKKSILSTIKKSLQPNLVILDLDNTCVCAVEFDDLDMVKDPDAFHYVDLENIYRIYERPGLQPFLDKLFATYDVAVWTAAGFDYAKFVIEQFILTKPERHLKFFMWDDHCTFSCDSTDTKQAKDLSLLFPLYDPNRLVLLDDNRSVLKQDHVINSLNFNVFFKKAKTDTFLFKAHELIRAYFETR